MRSADSAKGSAIASQLWLKETGAGRVTLKIYDITGREVTTLLNEQRNAGTYEVPFDTRSVSGGLASGVYFYRVQSGGFSETRKMLLLK